MNSVTFHPAKLQGSAALPPAKSEAHRALLLAALGQGECDLPGFTPPLCDDTIAMINGVTALGAQVIAHEDILHVIPAPARAAATDQIDCHVHACAAALRMLIPAFLVRGQAVRFVMEPGLFARPLSALEPLIEQIGGLMVRIPAGDKRYAHVEISGKMNAGAYEIDGTKSSQFASGLLIALSHATDSDGNFAPSTLTVTKPIVSRPYLDMTLRLMERFHVPYEEMSEGVFALAPATETSPGSIAVSGDWSQAAVLLCANAIGSSVMISGLCSDPEQCLQGDIAVLDVLRRMGLRLYHLSGELYAVSPSRAHLMATDIDCSDIPDLAPILALACSQATGASVLGGVSRLRIKECDRLDATTELLAQLGVKSSVSDNDDELTVYGPAKLRGGFEADARNDHRIVMFLAAAALISDAPITVHGVSAINKSWPGFWDTYKSLGGIVS
ncbi:MAG: hypothetical protein GX096_05770 [Clostridiales bacterium]|nr:hypothetical protein [Clostridiales bacterium]